MEHRNAIDWLAWGLSSIGAINWGFKGAADFDLVHTLLGWSPALERAVYVLVGVAGVVSLYRFGRFMELPKPVREVVTSGMRQAS